MADRRQTMQEIIEEGMAVLPRDDDGAVDEKLLREYVAERIPFDVDAAKLEKARRAIENAREPGTAGGEGQLKFDGMEAFDYEPKRLVLGEDRDIVENQAAKVKHKGAEARRTMSNANRAMQQAMRREQESSQFSSWAIEQMRAGREYGEIKFGAFVEETEIWKQPPPAEAPEEGG